MENYQPFDYYDEPLHSLCNDRAIRRNNKKYLATRAHGTAQNVN